MQKINFRVSIPFLKKLPVIFFIAAFALVVQISSGCKKGTPEITENLLEQYFELNILNNDFIVKYARTSANVVITPQYDGYTFRLFKNTLHDGPMTAVKNGVTYNGTWSSNDDYGNLVIALNHPTDPTVFTFLNRQWRFVRKAVPLMELAPWGAPATDSTSLHMERQ